MLLKLNSQNGIVLKRVLSFMMSLILVLSFDVLSAKSSSFASNSQGTYDTTFATNGLALGIQGTVTQFQAMKFDSSGRIVAGGFIESGSQYRFIVARFLANGSLDTTFGTSGYTILSPGTDDFIYTLAIDSSGRIVVGGVATIGSYSFALARLTPTGSLDSTFGTNGFNTTTLGTNDSIQSIAIDSSGRIIVGGNSTIGGVPKFTLARYTPNGAIDTSFATNGYNTTSPGTNDSINSIAFDGSGNIVAGGTATVGGVTGFAVARYTSNGALDTSFGTNGFNTTTRGTGDYIASIAIDASGRIVAGGNSTIGGNNVFTVARYLSNGSVDSTFGTNGFNTTTPGTSDYINSIALDSSGKIVGAGSATLGGATVTAVARYTSNGALDSTFGTNGINTSTPGTNDYFWVVAIDSSGNILAGGTATIAGAQGYEIARYLGGAPALSLTPSNSGSTSAPPPVQQSKIISLTPLSATVGSSTPVTLAGSFVEKVTNISINNAFLPSGTWRETPTSITFSIPALPVGTYSIQIYNGSAPLLAPQNFSYLPTPTPTPTPTPKPTPTPTPTPTINFKISEIYFDTNSSVLTPRDELILNHLILKLQDWSIQSIEIDGYSDSQGVEMKNLLLSKHRAQTVSKFLQTALSFRKILSIGKGAIDYPPGSQLRNRRVDISVFFIPK